ncbi:MAG: penicillin-binding protein 2 [Alphaproteobacteria bacterium]|jgi:penicillin-binding protein 2|nr:penicillin-binding protein 2 [Alphaproteobacteria bacterium]
MKNIKTFSRRVFVLLVLKLSLFVVLLVRLFQLQIKEGLHFNTLSDKNRTNLVPIIPKRGLINDNFNIALANNLFLWEALFLKSQIENNINLFINNIASIIVITEEDKQRILDDYKTKPPYFPILIKQNLSQSEIAAIETFSYNLPGVFIRPFYRRNYPFADAFAHVIGYTSITNDLAKSNNIPHWQIGRYGLEESLDPFLKGTVGYSKYEINAHGSIIRKLDQKPSSPGNNVAITIDQVLQNEIHKLLSQYNSASAVVSEIKTGRILAMPSYPSFNPNLFTEGISNKLWGELTNNEKAPLSNKALMGMYPPGSTIKPLMALIALERGLITPETTFTCKGYIDIGKERFHCWLHKGHGKVDLHNSIVQSCDVYYYNLASLLSLKDMNDVAKDFGFGAKHLPILSSESRGKTILSDEAEAKFSDKIIGVIGQGRWLVTPIQLNKMTAMIANDGVDLNYSLLKNIEYEDRVVYPKETTQNRVLPYKKEHFDFLRKALLDTVNARGGTAMLAGTGDKEWAMSGKTGTAQVRRISMRERETGVLQNYMIPWNRRDHALFIGFVPAHDPMYSISVVIEHGGSAATTAAPLGGEIAKLLKQRHPLYVAEAARIQKIIADAN